jgi:uncharacterized protein (DUF2336 family)
MPAALNPNARKAGAALIAEFEAALQRVTSQRRARMLLNIADLFVAVSDRIGDTEIAMFDNLLLGQFAITDHATLVTLSQRLSTVANAPPNLIEKFASNASAAIAGPVLSHSARLFTPDLVRYAAMHGQDHLHAICAREEIPEPLSAILLKRGGQSIVDRLALTLGARFHAADFAGLLACASADERKRVKVHQRAIMQTKLGMPIGECTVLNIAPAGAYLNPDGATNLPETFAVVFSAIERRRAPCRLVWKTGAGLGVAFDADPFGPALQP